MRKSVHSRFLCIFLMVSMLVLGIYCEDIHRDSSFSYVSGEFDSASLQSADHIADTQFYCEKGSLCPLGEFVYIRQSVRTLAGFRIHPYVFPALLMSCAYLLSLSFRHVNLRTDGYQNQYNRRTLEYIHHNDGKKSHIA